MELESYFDFLATDDIRVKGTRIGIEIILYDYIHRSQSPEAIAARYPSLTLANTLYFADDGALSRSYDSYTHAARRCCLPPSSNSNPDAYRNL